MYSSDEEKSALIEDFLRDRLSDAQRAEFEICMLEDEDLFREVQAAQALQKEIKKHAHLFHNSRGPAVTPVMLPFRRWISQPLSMAASVLLGVTLVYSVLSSHQGQGEAVNTGLAVRDLVLLESTRSAGNTVSVTGSGPYLLQIDAGLQSADTEYELVIRDVAAGSEIFRVDNLQADNSGWIRVVLTGSLSGQFSVEANWSGQQGEALSRNYEFQVND